MVDAIPYPDRYETHMALAMEKKAKWVESLLGPTEAEYEHFKMEMHRQEGALLALRNLMGVEAVKTALAPMGDSKALHEAIGAVIAAGEQNLNGLANKTGALAARINHMKGAHETNQFWRREYVWGFQDPETPGV